MNTKQLTNIENVEFPVAFKPAEISFDGYEDFKAKVDQLHESLESYEVTEANLKEAKETRAKLNKAKKAINSEKIRITKQAAEPITQFKNKVKGLLNTIDDSSTRIGDEIKVYEDKARQERKEKNLEQIKAMCELEHIDPDKIEYDSSWDNKSYSKTKFESDVDSQIALLKQQQQQLNEAIQVVSQKAEVLALPSEHWINELKTKSLSEVLEAMDKYKADLNQIAKQQHETKIKEAQELKKNGDHYYDATTGEIKEKVITIRMEVSGTKYQMQQLHRYLKDNAIEFHGLEG